jgi:hypothetical protein
MSKTTTKTATVFDQACEEGDLPAGVALARTALANNIFTLTLEDDPHSIAALLTDDAEDHGRPAGMTGDAWDYHGRHMFAALVMGIALGQMLHADVFTMMDGGK